MAGIVAALSYEEKNIVNDIAQAGMISRNRGAESSVMKLYSNGRQNVISIDDENMSSTSERYDAVKGIFFATKNQDAKKRVVESDFFLDGYIKNKEDLLGGFLRGGMYEIYDTAFVALENLLKRHESDLGSVADIFSRYARGIGVLNTDDGLIIMRDRNGFRTGWVGYDSEKKSRMFLQENYLFRQLFGIAEYREIECGEVMKLKSNGDISNELVTGERALIYDTHEIINGLDPRTNIFGKSVYNHRKSIGRKLSVTHEEKIDSLRKGKKNFVISCFPDAPRPAALGFSEKIYGTKSGEGQDEIFQRMRDSSLREQQKNFSKGKEFDFYYNRDLLCKDDLLIVIDDSLMTASNARQLGKLAKEDGVEPVYVSMEVPIIYPRQVGYFTVKKKLHNTDYIREIYKGKIRTVEQLDEKLKGDFGYTILHNNADDLAEAIFGNRDEKRKLAMPDFIKIMPAR